MWYGQQTNQCTMLQKLQYLWLISETPVKGENKQKHGSIYNKENKKYIAFQWTLIWTKFLVQGFIYKN